MDILVAVEENGPFVALTVFAVGMLQGAVIARGIRNRFPGLKRHARAASAVFLVLFSVSTAANVVKFANPAKFEVESAQNLGLESLTSAAANMLGIDGGIASSALIFVSVLLFLVFRTARMWAPARFFVFILSVIAFGLFLAAHFTGFVPSVLQLLMYAAYQVGITAGAFLVLRRSGQPDSLV